MLEESRAARRVERGGGGRSTGQEKRRLLTPIMGRCALS